MSTEPTTSEPMPSTLGGKIVIGPWHPSPHVALSCRRIEDLAEAAALRAALLGEAT